MCWRTRLRTLGILGAMILSPFTLAADGPRTATVCASAADDCTEEMDSVCLQAGGGLSVDSAQRP
jgi:hypothetical protein